MKEKVFSGGNSKGKVYSIVVNVFLFILFSFSLALFISASPEIESTVYSGYQTSGVSGGNITNDGFSGDTSSFYQQPIGNLNNSNTNYNGTYSFSFQISDTSGFSPSLTLSKPENETYITRTNLPLNFTVSNNLYTWYNIDSGTNTTISENTTFNTISDIEKIQTGADIELHLMVSNPQNYLPQNNEVIKKIIVQVESDGFSRELLEELVKRGFLVGLALNPETSFYDVEPFLDIIDVVQFMTIHPGFQGTAFIPETLVDIRKFHEEFPDMPIAIDGGMNPKTAKEVKEAGATFIVSGSYLLDNEDDLLEDLKKLEEAIL